MGLELDSSQIPGSAFNAETLTPVDGKPFFDGCLVDTCGFVVILQCPSAHPRTIWGTTMIEQTVPDEAASYRKRVHDTKVMR